MTTIIIADDHPIVRKGLRTLLDSEPDFTVIGEVGDGLEATQLVEQMKPNVLVLDVMMPGMSGLEVARKVKKHSPKTKIIMLSMYGNEAYVLEALQAGANAYVMKESAVEELIRAVHETTAGRRYLSSPLSERAIEVYLAESKDKVKDAFDQLSDRERQILYLIAEGCTNTEMAAKLYISPRTIEVHRSNLMHKLGISTQAELIRYAVQRGVIPGDA